MASRLVEDSRDGYLTVTAPKKKKAEKRAVIDLSTRAVADTKRRRFCECDPDAIEIEEE